MDRLLNTAIIGTSQIPTISFATESPVDEIIEQIPEANRERQLLLAAGAMSVARRAGYRAQRAPEEPVITEAEERGYCSDKAEVLLENLLTHMPGDQLQEALHLMKEAELILPPPLLPSALNIGNSKYQALLYPLLGKRGLWLSRFQEQWSWVEKYEREERVATTQEDEKIWLEGTLEQRYEVLKRLRNTSPEQGRSWLTNTWKVEQVEARKLLLRSLEEQLSQEDEEFLEQALSDRSPEIKEKAAELLAQLPPSAFSQRMQIRAEKLLFRKGEKIEVLVPTSIDAFWKHDGLGEDPNSAADQWHWLTQFLAHIPLKFWEEHFARSPEEIISGLNSESDSYQYVLSGWTRAVKHGNYQGWLLPLWHKGYQEGQQAAHETRVQSLRPILTPFLNRIKQSEAEELILASIGYGPGWEHFLSELPKPWSKKFSSFFLLQLAEYLQETESLTIYSNSWYTALPLSANAIHPDVFSQSIEISNPLKKKTGDITNWNRQLKRFRESIHIRKELRQEIHA